MLKVVLRGMTVGRLFEAGDNDYRFAYDEAAVEGEGGGSALVCHALPVRAEPYSHEESRPFVEALLPQGMWRRRVATGLGVDPYDSYALLAELGRDCPGAVSFVPEGEEGEAEEDGAPPAPIDAERLAGATAQPPQGLFRPESGPRPRFTLGGDRHKLALVRLDDGDWGWPSVAHPSTHVVKPEPGDFPEMVPAEMFCTALAAAAEIAVPETTVEEIGGRRCLVVRRFDREGDGPGARRLHQESFPQAIGYAAPLLEEEDEGTIPDLAVARAVLAHYGFLPLMPDVMRMAICHYAIGNGDAHPSNFALRLGEDGRAALAPAYDLVPTAYYDDPDYIGLRMGLDATRPVYSTQASRTAEAAEFDPGVFRKLIWRTSALVHEAIEPTVGKAREEGWHTPVVDGLARFLVNRTYSFCMEMAY